MCANVCKSMHSIPRRKKKREGERRREKRREGGKERKGFAKLISLKKVRSQPNMKVVFMLISNTHT